MSREYLVKLDDMGKSVESLTEYSIEKSESKANGRYRFFKVDDEGFIYSTLKRPSDITERDDYGDM